MQRYYAHERDVVFTPFMLRVRDVLDGGDAAAVVAVQLSRDRPTPRVVDDWFNYRIRAEHVVSEANAMLEHRAPLIDLVDEAGTGRLAFAIRWLDRSALFHVEEHDDHTARLVLERPEAAGGGPVEPADREVLEELVIDMLDNKET